MMKVQVSEVENGATLLVEGRLAQPFACELERCWQAVRTAHPDRSISVDLKGVTCIDRAGRHLLESMHEGGVRFTGAGLAIQDILDQIAGSAMRSAGPDELRM